MNSRHDRRAQLRNLLPRSPLHPADGEAERAVSRLVAEARHVTLVAHHGGQLEARPGDNGAREARRPGRASAAASAWARFASSRRPARGWCRTRGRPGCRVGRAARPSRSGRGARRCRSSRSAAARRRAPPSRARPAWSALGYASRRSWKPRSCSHSVSASVNVMSPRKPGPAWAAPYSAAGRSSAPRNSGRQRSDLLATRTALPLARRSMSAALIQNASRSTTANGGSTSASAASKRA